MHQVIASECTGCGLCTDPCPVDCIHLEPLPETVSTWKWPYPTPLRQPVALPPESELLPEHREAA